MQAEGAAEIGALIASKPEQLLPGESLPTSCSSPSWRDTGSHRSSASPVCLCPARGESSLAPLGAVGPPPYAIPPLSDICSLGRNPQVSTGTRSLARYSGKPRGGGGTQHGMALGGGHGLDVSSAAQHEPGIEVRGETKPL